MDLFLAYALCNENYASILKVSLSAKRLQIGSPLQLLPGQRLLPQLDPRLSESRFALVVLTVEFLGLGFSRNELDRLTRRSKVLSILAGVTEREIAGHSPRLAVAALPSSANLSRLILPA